MTSLTVATEHLATPLFQQMAQRNQYPMRKLSVKRGSEFEDDFAGLVREAIGRLDAGFAPNSRNHCIITSNNVRREKIDGVSFIESAETWVNGRKEPTKLIEK